MIVLSITGLIAIYLAYMGSKGRNPFGLELAFVVAAFVAAIHYEYGNDFNNYYKTFVYLSEKIFSWEEWKNGVYHRELGWSLLCFAFKPFGFMSLIAFLSIFQNFIYYLIVKKCVDPNWWVFAVFLYLFQSNFYVLNMSMLRQGLAETIVALAWFLLRKKKNVGIIIGVLLLWLATTFHTSAWVVGPFVLLVLLPMKYTKIYGIAILVLFFIFLLNHSLADFLMSFFIDQESFETYSFRYTSTREFSIGLGFILLRIPFILSLFYLFTCPNNLQLDEKKSVVLLSSAGTLFIPFALNNAILNRFVFYFLPYSLVAYPIVYNLSNKYVQKILLVLLVVVTVYSFFSFFFLDTWKNYFLNFNSIFSVIF